MCMCVTGDPGKYRTRDQLDHTLYRSFVQRSAGVVVILINLLVIVGTCLSKPERVVDRVIGILVSSLL